MNMLNLFLTSGTNYPETWHHDLEQKPEIMKKCLQKQIIYRQIILELKCPEHC